MPQHKPEEIPQSRVQFSCNHWSKKVPTSRPFLTGIYPHRCHTCMRNDNKFREDRIKGYYHDEINGLSAIIAEKKRIKSIVRSSDSPRFMTHMQQGKDARVQKMGLEYQQELEIKDVWKAFDRLWPALRT